jgi:hypothetical protein
MRNYRIKKQTCDDISRYFPQHKFLFWWYDMCAYAEYSDGGYKTFEEAQKTLCDYLKKPVVEYLEVNCEKLK